MNEIVKIHQDFVDLPLKRFTASEMDILLAICHQCQDKNTTEVSIPLNKIKDLSHYKNKNDVQFIDSVKDTNRKLLSLNFEIRNDEKIVQFVLFPIFEIDKKNEYLKVKVNEPFAYILNDLNFYTSLELQESASLKSAYSKQIYKKLKRFRFTGMWKVRLDDFRDYLDIPKSFQISKIDERVVKTALAELSPYFNALKCEKWYDKKKGKRGRPSVSGYIWTFDPEQNENQLLPQREPSQEEIAEVTGWEKTGRFCPKCKRPIFKKQLENENGRYYLYGHTDFKTGECAYSTYDYSNLLQDYQIQEDQMEVNEEGKSKLAGLIKNLFK